MWEVGVDGWQDCVADGVVGDCFALCYGRYLLVDYKVAA